MGDPGSFMITFLKLDAKIKRLFDEFFYFNYMYFGEIYLLESGQVYWEL